MAIQYPAGTTTIRNLENKYYYFLVVRPDDLIDDIPQKEYFVYRYKVPASASTGIKNLRKYFSTIQLTTCIQLSDNEYATGKFQHPTYTNQKNLPLEINYREIPIYKQSTPGKIDLNKDVYSLGSTPIITNETQVIVSK